ncbi:MAG: DUF6064 family protein [Caldimonas sp.]
MSMPFSQREFEWVFALYNSAIWPLQPLAHGLGLLMLVSLLKPSPTRDRAVVIGLAALWAWIPATIPENGLACIL